MMKAYDYSVRYYIYKDEDDEVKKQRVYIGRAYCYYSYLGNLGCYCRTSVYICT